MDLKSFREDKLRLKSQTAFAELLGEPPYVISRWEKNPNELSIENVIKIMTRTGVSFEELTDWTKPTPEALQVTDTWATVAVTKGMLQATIHGLNAQGDVLETHQQAYLQEIPEILRKLTKPRVALVGCWNAGKSTLINTLLGAHKLPIGCTPTTSIAIYIKDKADRPAFIEEDVWIFKRNNGTEDTWDISCLEDEAICRGWKLAAGGVERLAEFGTRQGESAGQSAGSAVVFLDAPILKICDLIDFPGYGTGDEIEEEMTFGTTRQADVLLYLSSADRFMGIEDINHLKPMMRELPIWEKKDHEGLAPLENLFIVASKVDIVDGGNPETLRKILDIGSHSLCKTLPEEYWRQRYAVSGYDIDWYQDALDGRFFTFSTDAPHLRSDLNEALVSVLEQLSALIYQNTIKQMDAYIGRQLKRVATDRSDAKMEQTERWNRIKFLRTEEPHRKNLTDILRSEILRGIEFQEQLSLDEFRAFTQQYYTAESTAKTMVHQDTPNTRAGVELFGSYWVSNAELQCEEILVKNYKRLKPLLKDYRALYTQGDSGFTPTVKMRLNHTPSFAGGSYDQSEYSFNGIDEPSDYTIGSAIVGGALFGVVGMALGTVVGQTLGSSLRSDNWERTTSKKMVRTYFTESGPQRFEAEISAYWRNLSRKFTKKADKMEHQWCSYIENLERQGAIQSQDDRLRMEQSFGRVEEFLHQMLLLK